MVMHQDPQQQLHLHPRHHRDIRYENEGMEYGEYPYISGAHVQHKQSCHVIHWGAHFLRGVKTMNGRTVPTY